MSVFDHDGTSFWERVIERQKELEREEQAESEGSKPKPEARLPISEIEKILRDNEELRFEITKLRATVAVLKRRLDE